MSAPQFVAPSLAAVNDPKGLEVDHSRGKKRIQESLARAGRRFLRTGFCFGTAHGEGGLPTVSGVGGLSRSLSSSFDFWFWAFWLWGFIRC